MNILEKYYNEKLKAIFKKIRDSILDFFIEYEVYYFEENAKKKMAIKTIFLGLCIVTTIYKKSN